MVCSEQLAQHLCSWLVSSSCCEDALLLLLPSLLGEKGGKLPKSVSRSVSHGAAQSHSEEGKSKGITSKMTSTLLSEGSLLLWS